jgi:hypothetical protein
VLRALFLTWILLVLSIVPFSSCDHNLGYLGRKSYVVHEPCFIPCLIKRCKFFRIRNQDSGGLEIPSAFSDTGSLKCPQLLAMWEATLSAWSKRATTSFAESSLATLMPITRVERQKNVSCLICLLGFSRYARSDGIFSVLQVQPKPRNR